MSADSTPDHHPSSAAQRSAETDRLDGWKEISDYLGKSGRTAQRWERLYRLPVRRSADLLKAPVFALRSEIDHWMLSSNGLAAAEESTREGSAEAATDGGGESPSRQEPDEGLATAARPDAGAPVAKEAAHVDSARWPSLAWAAVLVAGVVALVGAAWWNDSACPPGPDTVSLSWRSAGDLASPRTMPNGVVLDPGYVEVRGNSVLFHYEKRESRWQASPYAFAPLPARLVSPALSLRLTPHADGRLAHWVGFMNAAAGFDCRSVDVSGTSSCGPATGAWVELGRTHAGLSNSGVTVVAASLGEPQVRTLKRLPFQFDPGRSYDVTFSLEGKLLTAIVSHGPQSVTVTAQTPGALPSLDQVFINGPSVGASNSAPPGHYTLTVGDIRVREITHDVTFDIARHRPAAERPSPGEVSLVVLSNQAIATPGLDLSTLLVAGTRPLLAPTGSYRCEQRDDNADGLRDLVCAFDRQALIAGARGESATLTARDIDGLQVCGVRRLDLTSVRAR